MVNYFKISIFELEIKHSLNKFFTDSRLWKRIRAGLTRHLGALSETRNGVHCRLWYYHRNLLPRRNLQWCYLRYCCGALDLVGSQGLHSDCFPSCLLHWLFNGLWPQPLQLFKSIILTYHSGHMINLYIIFLPIY